jgi:hypothetical protein
VLNASVIVMDDQSPIQTVSVSERDDAGSHVRPDRLRVDPRSNVEASAGSTRALLLRAICVALSCFGAALVATWPLALNLTSAIPEGTEHEATVSLFSLWGLWWTADRAAHGFAGYWDAPFFHPARGVTTFSEPFPLVGLGVAPLWGVGLPPALIYNLAFLSLLTLNGAFAYRLARSLGAATRPALLGGVVAVTLPFIAKVEGALPLVAVFGIPWTLEGLVPFGKEGSRRWAAWAALGLVATYLTCQQYALLFGPLAVAAGLVALAQRRFGQQAVLRLGGAGLIAGVVLAFVALPGLRVHAEQGFRRSEDLVRELSARPGDFLTRPELATVQIPPADPSDTGGLFPGALVLVLAAVGSVAGIQNPATRRWTIYLVAGAAASLLLAMALNVNIDGWQPFATVRAIVPGMSELRSPTRASAIMQLFLVMLGAMGLSRAWGSLGQRSAAILLAIGLLAAAENLSVPARLAPVPFSVRTAWTDWVRAQPDDTVLAHVPFPAGLHVSDYEIEARRMVAQIEHQKPIVNGYSGNFPQARTPLGLVIPIYTQFQLAMSQQFPSQQLLCIMDRGLDVNLLVVDRDWLSSHAAQIEAYSGFLEPAYADDQVQIYRLHPPAGKCT